MLNSEEKIESTDREMSSTKSKKRIYNPKTGRYYQIRQRSSVKGPKGTIMGTWSPPPTTRKKRK
jgi:hypothetical protein